jgi:YHS domain-containing protein
MGRLAVYAGLGLLLVVLLLAWGRSARSRRTGSPAAEAMVLDPVCSTYVPRARAVIRRIDGVDHAFCSRKCADAFSPAEAPRADSTDRRG